MKVKVDQKRVDDFHSASTFMAGTLVEESFLKAHELCNRYMRTANGVIGQVGLETVIYEHVVLPCRIVLKGGETK